MIAKTTPVSRLRRVADNAIVSCASRDEDQDISPLLPKPTLVDIRNVVVVDARKKMAAARKNAVAARDQARDALADTVAALAVLGPAAVKAFIIPDSALMILSGLNSWCERKYIICLERPDSTRGYNYNTSEKDSLEPKMDVTTRTITAEVRFYPAFDGQTPSGTCHIDELDKVVVIPFTVDMHLLADQINARQTDLIEAEANLKQVNRLAATVDDRGDELSAAITTAQVQGRISHMADIGTVMNEVITNDNLLPEPLRRFLPAPEDTQEE